MLEANKHPEVWYSKAAREVQGDYCSRHAWSMAMLFKLIQGCGRNLPDAFTGDIQSTADLFQRLDRTVTQAKTPRDNGRLPRC